MEAEDNIPFESWFSRDYKNQDVCFLCGRQLEKKNSSKEHIFPQWILNKFQLWEKRITLLNKAEYNYRKSTIPCCAICNNDHLASLESEIKNGVEKGYDFFKANVPQIRIYQWCQLIVYKWLFRETFFRKDLKNPESVEIVSKEQFGSMTLNHLLLRSIDKDITFENFFPASIYICRVKTSDDPSLNFDYQDSIPEQCVSIRMNDIGIVIMLADAGLHKQAYLPILKDILDHELAPIQFKNLFARCLYIQTLFNDPYRYVMSNITAESLSITITIRPDFSGSSVYGEWIDSDYLQVLGAVFNVDPKGFLAENGRPGSLFYDNKGNWKERSFSDSGFKED